MKSTVMKNTHQFYLTEEALGLSALVAPTGGGLLFFLRQTTQQINTSIRIRRSNPPPPAAAMMMIVSVEMPVTGKTLGALVETTAIQKILQ